MVAGNENPSAGGEGPQEVPPLLLKGAGREVETVPASCTGQAAGQESSPPHFDESHEESEALRSLRTRSLWLEREPCSDGASHRSLTASALEQLQPLCSSLRAADAGTNVSLEGLQGAPQIRPRRTLQTEQQLLERTEHEALVSSVFTPIQKPGNAYDCRRQAQQQQQQQKQQQQEHPQQYEQPQEQLQQKQALGRSRRQRARRGGRRHMQGAPQVAPHPSSQEAARQQEIFSTLPAEQSAGKIANGSSSSICSSRSIAADSLMLTCLSIPAGPAPLLSPACKAANAFPKPAPSQGCPHRGSAEGAKTQERQRKVQRMAQRTARKVRGCQFFRLKPNGPRESFHDPREGPPRESQQRNATETVQSPQETPVPSDWVVKGEFAVEPLQAEAHQTPTERSRAVPTPQSSNEEELQGVPVPRAKLLAGGWRSALRFDREAASAIEEAPEAFIPSWAPNGGSCPLGSQWGHAQGDPCKGAQDTCSDYVPSALSWPLEGDSERSSHPTCPWGVSAVGFQGDPQQGHPHGCNKTATDTQTSYDVASDSGWCCCCCSSRSSSGDGSRRSCSSNPTEQETPPGHSEDEGPLAAAGQQGERLVSAHASNSSSSSSSSSNPAVAAGLRSKLHRADMFLELPNLSPSSPEADTRPTENQELDRSGVCLLRPLWMAAPEGGSSSRDSSRSRDGGSSSRESGSSSRDSGSSSRDSGSSERRRRSFYSSEICAEVETTPEGTKRLRRGTLSHSSTARPQGPLGPLHEGVLIFDWDDTFFPNSWLAGHNLSLSSDPAEYAEDAPLLRKLTISGRRVLRAALKIGSVILVTNAALGWIDETCKKFLPGLWPTVEPLRRVSARYHFDSPTCESPFLWKRLAFKEQMDRHLSEHKECRTVISIGDGPHERDALFFLQAEYSSSYRFSCKSLKLMEVPSLERLNKQHGLLLHTLEDLLGHDGDLDLCVRGPDEEHFPSFGDHCSFGEAGVLALNPMALASGEETWGPLGAPTRSALRILNVKWRQCKKSKASLLRIDHHFSLVTAGMGDYHPHCG